MISSHALDIVGFQEVRLEAATGTNNQIGQLAHFLPHYQVLVAMHTCWREQALSTAVVGVHVFVCVLPSITVWSVSNCLVCVPASNALHA